MKRIMGMILCLTGLFVASCAHHPRNNIVGIWVPDRNKGSVEYEFRKDGNVVIFRVPVEGNRDVVKEREVSKRMTYRVENNVMTMHPDTDGTEGGPYRVEFKNGKLILTHTMLTDTPPFVFTRKE